LVPVGSNNFTSFEVEFSNQLFTGLFFEKEPDDKFAAELHFNADRAYKFSLQGSLKFSEGWRTCSPVVSRPYSSLYYTGYIAKTGASYAQ
jgi:hypothetical protein